MKAILFAGATLMIGASIYGLVDYNQTSGKKEFKKMYTEETTVVPVANTAAPDPVNTTVAKEEKNTVTPNKEVKKSTVAVKKKTNKKKRTFSTRLFSRGALDERYIEPVPPTDLKTDIKKTTEKEK